MLARNKVCGSNFRKYCDMNSDRKMKEGKLNVNSKLFHLIG